MKGWTVKKIILRCFFKIGLFCLHTKFQVSQSSPSGFLSKNAIFFILFAEKIFFLKNIYGFTPVKKRIIRFGPKMSKSKAITFKDLFNSLLLSIAAQCSGSEQGFMRTFSFLPIFFISLIIQRVGQVRLGYTVAQNRGS